MSIELRLKKIDGTYRLIDGKKRSNSKANKFLNATEIRGLSLQTTRAYGYDLLYLHRWLSLAKKQWKGFSQRDLLKFIAYQKAQDAKPKSINRRLATCELFYSFCFNGNVQESRGVNMPSPFYKGRGYDKNNGLFFIPKPNRKKLRVKVPRPLIEILNPDEVHTFMKGITRYRDLAIVSMMLTCGTRFSEVLLLCLDDINFIERSFKINGKGSKQRVLPMPNQLINLFKQYLRYERPSQSTDKNFFVILQGPHKGKKMTSAGLRSLFRYRRKKSKITKANPHKFRHTFGSEMAGANMELPILQRLMGHCDPVTTLQYIHLSNLDLSREFERATNEIAKNYVI
jgi:site-specific recombinase XerD